MVQGGEDKNNWSKDKVRVIKYRIPEGSNWPQRKECEYCERAKCLKIIFNEDLHSEVKILTTHHPAKDEFIIQEDVVPDKLARAWTSVPAEFDAPHDDVRQNDKEYKPAGPSMKTYQLVKVQLSRIWDGKNSERRSFES